MTITKDQAIAAADVIDAEYPTYTREGRVDSAVLTLRQFIEQSVSPPGAPAPQPELTDAQILDEASHHGFLGSREQLLKFSRGLLALLPVHLAAGDAGQDSRGSGEAEDCSSGHDETGRTSVAAGDSAPSAGGEG